MRQAFAAKFGELEDKRIPAKEYLEKKLSGEFGPSRYNRDHQQGRGGSRYAAIHQEGWLQGCYAIQPRAAKAAPHRSAERANHETAKA